MAQTNRKKRVKDLAVRDVISVQPNDPLSEAIQLLVSHRVNAMPVVDSRGRCKGIFSSTDLIRVFHRQAVGDFDSGDPAAETGGAAASASSPASIATAMTSAPLVDRLRVSDIMTRDVMTLTPEDPILDAAREMVRSRIHRLVVVDANQRVVGILSTLDLLEAFSADD